MKDKLKKFSEFSNTIMPHEVDYLMSMQNFKDADNHNILDVLCHNSKFPNEPKRFNVDIDKRKYSKVMKWVNIKLQSIDVDSFFNMVSRLNNSIITDSISNDDEKNILDEIKNFKSHYFFTEFYEMVRNYGDYLLIRHRHAYYATVFNFLELFKSRYDKSLSTKEKLHTVTGDIINQFSNSSIDALKWEECLIDVFYDQELDGRNRFLAVVRLTYLYLFE